MIEFALFNKAIGVLKLWTFLYLPLFMLCCVIRIIWAFLWTNPSDILHIEYKSNLIPPYTLHRSVQVENSYTRVDCGLLESGPATISNMYSLFLNLKLILCDFQLNIFFMISRNYINRQI